MEPKEMPQGTPDPGQADVLAKENEELKKRNGSLESELLARTERANRAEALLQSYTQGNPAAPPAVSAAPANPYGGAGIDVSRLITEPQAVLDQVVKVAVDQSTKIMEKRYWEAEQLRNQRESIRVSFFKENPDLVGFEKIVGIVEDEMRLKYPNVPYLQLIPDIANAARKEILALRTRLGGAPKEEPLGLENGKLGARDGNPPAPEPKVLTEAEENAAYLKERAEVRNKRLL